MPQPIPPTPQADPDTKGSGQAQGTTSLNLRLEPGETTIDDKLTFEIDAASYQEMRKLTAVIRARLGKTLKGEGQHVFFLDNALRAALDLSATIDLQLSNLQAAYARVITMINEALAALQPPPPPAPASPPDEPVLEAEATESAPVPEAFPIAAVAADAAVALIGALRIDTRFSGRQVVIPEQAFVLALAHQYQDDESVEFHYPTLFVPPTERRRQLLSEFVKSLDTVLSQRTAASRALSSLLSRVSLLDSKAATFVAAKVALDTARDQFQAAEAVFDNLSTQLVKADEKTGLTQMQLLERAAFVRAIATKAPGRAFYLYAQVVSAGGSFRTTKNFFISLFGTPLEHAGGCIVSYALFDDEGRLRASDTIGARSAYEDSRPAINFG